MSVYLQLRALPQKLLSWYNANARILPWRLPPGSRVQADPYAIWLSEVMLQQTTVAAVKPYYATFMARWPRVENLAAAEDADVMAAWAGLGYYARARNLLACARAVVRDHAGGIPDTYDELRTLPGLGDYTAASVAAIAFGRAVPVIDANVERVMARVCAIDRPLAKARPAIRAILAPLVPNDVPGDFAQAVMDLGATVCTPRNPRCMLCPLAEICVAYTKDAVDEFPVKSAKLPKPDRYGIAYWVECDGRVLLVRRPAKGLLGGMLGLPGLEWQKRKPPQHTQCLARVVHNFTHFRLTLDTVALDISTLGPQDKVALEQCGQYWDLQRLHEAGLPTLYAKAVTAVLAQRE
jgi:A/G-specific adenine glycosylase